MGLVDGLVLLACLLVAVVVVLLAAAAVVVVVVVRVGAARQVVSHEPGTRGHGTHYPYYWMPVYLDQR